MEKKILDDAVPTIRDVVNGILKERGLKHSLGKFSLIPDDDIGPEHLHCGPDEKICIDPETGHKMCRKLNDPCN